LWIEFGLVRRITLPTAQTFHNFRRQNSENGCDDANGFVETGRKESRLTLENVERNRLASNQVSDAHQASTERKAAGRQIIQSGNQRAYRWRSRNPEQLELRGGYALSRGSLRVAGDCCVWSCFRRFPGLVRLDDGCDVYNSTD
jgi:hypothetical protein